MSAEHATDFAARLNELFTPDDVAVSPAGTVAALMHAAAMIGAYRDVRPTRLIATFVDVTEEVYEAEAQVHFDEVIESIVDDFSQMAMKVALRRVFTRSGDATPEEPAAPADDTRPPDQVRFDDGPTE